MVTPLLRRALVLATCLALPLIAAAQPNPASLPTERGRGPSTAAPAEGRRLPVDVSSEHEVALPGRNLSFIATAGSLPLVDGAGVVQAEIGVVSYRLKGADPASRPVTFAVNGGPGASSAYLHLLLAGPWRLPVEGNPQSPSASPLVVPNAETWLDFTDLVFIDPVGTGYSRANGSEEQTRDRYYTVEGDISALAAVIARWLRENDRLLSPKLFLGESYGGFRGPLLSEKLRSETGTALSGLVLLSPVFDFGWLSEPRWKPMEFVTRLPSFAAAALERKGPVERSALDEAEQYAGGEYLLDLLRGPAEAAATHRMSARVAALTGIDPAIVHQRGGRLDLATFRREFRRGEGLVVSAYDTGEAAYDPDPTSPISEADIGLAALRAPLSTAAVDLLWRRLGWRVPNARYELLNGSVNGQWRYGRGRRSPESLSELRDALALDPKFRVLVAHGLTDLVTPYFASELLLRQLPAYGGEQRAKLATYPGGHMFYTRDAARAAFREDARRLYEQVSSARPGD